MADRQVKITLTKSVIGEKPKTRATIEALGLRRLHQTVTHPDTPSLRGALLKVDHLVVVEEG
ncbi:MAG: 50S ribosomal protein L30 [Actinobacteria bacterium]|nr:50S ribosomal protein L30 [Actinomycetota bacterium]MCI0545060.1 50S ribosomal protein L30 [Actinomycetota bacterium]MCI0677870.1 50S ribosomal protein L30 [Actinomycetota bacterium]